MDRESLGLSGPNGQPERGHVPRAHVPSSPHLPYPPSIIPSAVPSRQEPESVLHARRR